MNPDVATDLGRFQGLQGAGLPDAVNVGEGDLEPLVAGQVDTDQAGHKAVTFRLFDARCCCADLSKDQTCVAEVSGVMRPRLPSTWRCSARSPGPRPPTEGELEIAFERAVTLWVVLSPAVACGGDFRKSPSRDRAGGSPCTCHRSS